MKVLRRPTPRKNPLRGRAWYYSGSEETGKPSLSALDSLAVSRPPRTNRSDPPTARVSAANHRTVTRWWLGTASSNNRLSNPIQEIVRLRKRNTGAVKSGESPNSTATSMGVARFLNNRARAGVSPRSSSMLKKKTPNDAGTTMVTSWMSDQ